MGRDTYYSRKSNKRHKIHYLRHCIIYKRLRSQWSRHHTLWKHCSMEHYDVSKQYDASSKQYVEASRRYGSVTKRYDDDAKEENNGKVRCANGKCWIQSLKEKNIMPKITVPPSKRLILINAFIAHWQGYNVRLCGTAATEFKVKATRTVAELITLRDAYSATLTTLEGARNARQTATGLRDDKKTALQKRITAFNRAARC